MHSHFSLESCFKEIEAGLASVPAAPPVPVWEIHSTITQIEITVVSGKNILVENRYYLYTDKRILRKIRHAQNKVLSQLHQTKQGCHTLTKAQEFKMER